MALPRGNFSDGIDPSQASMNTVSLENVIMFLHSEVQQLRDAVWQQNSDITDLKNKNACIANENTSIKKYNDALVEKNKQLTSFIKEALKQNQQTVLQVQSDYLKMQQTVLAQGETIDLLIALTKRNPDTTGISNRINEPPHKILMLEGAEEEPLPKKLDELSQKVEKLTQQIANLEAAFKEIPPKEAFAETIVQTTENLAELTQLRGDVEILDKKNNSLVANLTNLHTNTSNLLDTFTQEIKIHYETETNILERLSALETRLTQTGTNAINSNQQIEVCFQPEETRTGTQQPGQWPTVVSNTIFFRGSDRTHPALNNSLAEGNRNFTHNRITKN